MLNGRWLFVAKTITFAKYTKKPKVIIVKMSKEQTARQSKIEKNHPTTPLNQTTEFITDLCSTSFSLFQPPASCQNHAGCAATPQEC